MTELPEGAPRPTPGDALRAAVARDVHAHGDDLVALSHRIHAHPELAFDEHRAAGWCAAALRPAGFTATVGAWGLPTAMDARLGAGDVTVAFCAEYDALPGVGHACGHNLIAAAAVGAGIALAGVAADAGLTVRVLGTPAEEAGGGKARLLHAGAFAGVDAAMMVHAGPEEIAAFRSFAHFAVAARFEGPGAGDAAGAAVGAAAGLDDELPDGARLSQYAPPWTARSVPPEGLPGTVPPPSDGVRTATVHLEARAPEEVALEAIRRDLERLLRRAAVDARCTVLVGPGEPDYRPFRTDPALAQRWTVHARALGRPEPVDRGPFAMTDMGNVSHAVRAIHPMLALGDGTVHPHDPAFAGLVVTPEADAALLDAAVAMAWTALDLAPGAGPA